MIFQKAARKAMWLGICGILFLGFAEPAGATTITSYSDASLTSGPLAGTNFTISFSYDNSSLAGVGQEFLFLQSFNFTLLGTQFTLADIGQGGQAVFENGSLYLVEASFLPEPPQSPVVTSLAFGFGGPGIIGYADSDGQPGEGSYTLVSPAGSVSTPEPGTLFTLIFGLIVLLVVRRYRQWFSTGRS